MTDRSPIAKAVSQLDGSGIARRQSLVGCSEEESFGDGTELVFRGGHIPLRRDEWLNVIMEIEVFAAFLAGKAFPAAIGWRDISEVIGLRCISV